MAVKTFTSGEVLTASDTNTYLNNGGLVYIGATTLSAVTNNVSNVFSSTYDAYRVVISNLNNGSTTTRQINIRFRSGAGDDTSANYFYAETYYYNTNLIGNQAQAGQTVGRFGNLASGASNGAGLTIDIVNPNLACATTYMGNMNVYQSDVGYYVMRSIFGGINTTTQYTGFSIIGTTDNLSGTVRVYGYRQA